MIALLQRVTRAAVVVNGESIAHIDKGLLVLLGIEQGDDQVKADKLVRRMLGYRVFEDAQGKMNLSLRDISGQLLLVPQFTLAADTNRGMRPSFSSAATPGIRANTGLMRWRDNAWRCWGLCNEGSLPQICRLSW